MCVLNVYFNDYNYMNSYTLKYYVIIVYHMYMIYI